MNSKSASYLKGFMAILGAGWSAVAFLVLHFAIGYALETYLYSAKSGVGYALLGLILLAIMLAIIGGFYILIRSFQILLFHVPLEDSPKSLAFIASYLIPVIAYLWITLGTEEELFPLWVVLASVILRIVFDYLYRKYFMGTR